MKDRKSKQELRSGKNVMNPAYFLNLQENGYQLSHTKNLKEIDFFSSIR